GGDMSSEAKIVNGSVVREGAPMEGAYVRVLGRSGEFVNERRTGSEGTFKLHLTPATWTFIAFGSGTSRIERAVTVDAGADAEGHGPGLPAHEDAREENGPPVRRREEPSARLGALGGQGLDARHDGHRPQPGAQRHHGRRPGGALRRRALRRRRLSPFRPDVR